MQKGIVVLHSEFNENIVNRLIEGDIQVVSLHLNPLQGSVLDFVEFVNKNAYLIQKLQKAGITVDYRLHVVNHFLPVKTNLNENIFRMDKKGNRVNDFNICPSSEEGLKLIENGAEQLARSLNQTSHRYHFWTDDDMGKDTRCNCVKCRDKSFTYQNATIYNAMLKGIKKFDPLATLSYLVYGNESIDNRLNEGLFIEFAPFLRRHDLPIEASENKAIKQNYENILKIYEKENVEVLEYFLSYDFKTFCSFDQRVYKDILYYKSTNPYLLTTFLVNNLNREDEEGLNNGLKKYFSL